MKTGLLIALAFLCAVSARAQQTPGAEAAKATIRIRASDLLRQSPQGSNTVVVAAAPQTAAPLSASPATPPPPTATATPPPGPAPVPGTLPPPPGPAPVSASPPAAMAAPNTVAAPDPAAKQTFQQSTLTGDEPIEFDWMNADLSQVLSKYSELTHRSAIMQQGM